MCVVNLMPQLFLLVSFVKMMPCFTVKIKYLLLCLCWIFTINLICGEGYKAAYRCTESKTKGAKLPKRKSLRKRSQRSDRIKKGKTKEQKCKKPRREETSVFINSNPSSPWGRGLWSALASENGVLCASISVVRCSCLKRNVDHIFSHHYWWLQSIPKTPLYLVSRILSMVDDTFMMKGCYQPKSHSQIVPSDENFSGLSAKRFSTFPGTRNSATAPLYHYQTPPRVCAPDHTDTPNMHGWFIFY